MRVVHYASAKSRGRVLNGPSELGGESAGFVAVVGRADEVAAARWVVALGQFVVRGGSITRKQPGGER